MDHHLLEKYFKGTCTASEKARVEDWLHAEEDLPMVDLSAGDELIREEASFQIYSQIKTNADKKLRVIKYISAAAVLVCVSLSLIHI